jgi:hypothetical protein
VDAIMAALDALQQRADQLQGAPAAAPVQPPRPQSPSAAPPPPEAAPAAHPRQAPARPAGLLHGLFEDGNSLLRAVVAAEVLQPPLALREPALWIQQPNEPSI